MSPNRQVRDDVLQIVVQGIIFCRQFRKEQFGQVRNALIGIFETFGHFTKLAFDFDHAVEDQMSQYHECVFLDSEIGIRQTLI